MENTVEVMDKKFLVSKSTPADGSLFSTQDVLEVIDNIVKLNFTVD